MHAHGKERPTPRSDVAPASRGGVPQKVLHRRGGRLLYGLGRWHALMWFGMNYRCPRLSSVLPESRRQGPALRPQRPPTLKLDTEAAQKYSHRGLQHLDL